MISGSPACSCLQNYIGTPPDCRPECVLNSECASQEACINQKCKDPCPGSCGFDANCHVLNHVPICTCNDGYTGDPFVRCNIVPPCKLIKKQNNNIFTILKIIFITYFIFHSHAIACSL